MIESWDIDHVNSQSLSVNKHENAPDNSFPELSLSGVYSSDSDNSRYNGGGGGSRINMKKSL